MSCSEVKNEGEQVASAKENKEAIYSIEGEDIPLRKGPGESFDKIVNEKASKMLNETRYVQVGPSFKVKVDEEKDEWSRISTIEPEHLTSSHNGWIKDEYLIGKDDNSEVAERFAPSEYKVLKIEKKASVTNYYVLIKSEDFNKDRIKEFISGFRKEQCESNCNIHLYDTKEFIHLVSKNSLADSEYLAIADHYIAMSTFDAPELVWMYPFQDKKYEELGGENWKKDKPN